MNKRIREAHFASPSPTKTINLNVKLPVQLVTRSTPLNCSCLKCSSTMGLLRPMEKERVLQKTASNVLDVTRITHLRFISTKGLVKGQISRTWNKTQVFWVRVQCLCYFYTLIFRDPEGTLLPETWCAISWNIIWSVFSRKVCFAHLYHFWNRQSVILDIFKSSLQQPCSTFLQ